MTRAEPRPILPVAVPDLYAFLRGRWSIDRTIADHRDGLDGHFIGEAVFQGDFPELAYTEAGTLTLPHHTGEAHRAYRYEFDTRSACRVLFTDGRLFHTLDLSAGRCAAFHPCSEDRYEGVYGAADNDTLLVRWRITGPRKDLIIATTFRRAGAGCAAAAS